MKLLTRLPLPARRCRSARVGSAEPGRHQRPDRRRQGRRDRTWVRRGPRREDRLGRRWCCGFHRRRAADRRPGTDADARVHRRASPHRPGQRRGVAEDTRRRAAPGVPRRGFHHRAVRDLPGGRRRGPAARRGRYAAGASAADGADPPAGACACAGWGRPRRSRAVRHVARAAAADPARRRNSNGRHDQAVEAVASQRYDFIKTVITTTPNGPETRTR